MNNKIIAVIVLSVALAMCLKAQVPSAGTSKDSDVKAQTTEYPKNIANLIPQNGAVAKILRMSNSERYAQLTQKMQQALADKQSWFQEYLKQNGQGKLKYHSNFGVTEAEYQEIILGFDDFRLVESGEKTTLKVEQHGNKITLSSDKYLEKFSNIVIDTKRNRIVTEFGECGEMSKSQSSKVFEIAGSWKGYSWSCEKSDEKEEFGYFFQFTIGKFDQSANVYLAYSGGKQSIDSSPLVFNIWLKILMPNQKKVRKKK
jgi:hypothetical protein